MNIESNTAECECEENEFRNHWTEDQFGNETRVKCNCDCRKCEEY